MSRRSISPTIRACSYDAADGRWIAAAADNAGKPDNFLLAVSNTQRPDRGLESVRDPGQSDGQIWGDFPTLGMNGAGIFLASNNSLADAAGSTVLTIDKASLLAGTLNFSRVENQSYIGVRRHPAAHRRPW